METFIVLTAGQADHVRGPSISTQAAALNPIERQGGTFVLGIDVLTDPAHLVHREVLSGFPRLDSGDHAFPAASMQADA